MYHERCCNGSYAPDERRNETESNVKTTDHKTGAWLTSFASGFLIGDIYKRLLTDVRSESQVFETCNRSNGKRQKWLTAFSRGTIRANSERVEMTKTGLAPVTHTVRLHSSFLTSVPFRLFLQSRGPSQLWIGEPIRRAVVIDSSTCIMLGVLLQEVQMVGSTK